MLLTDFSPSLHARPARHISYTLREERRADAAYCRSARRRYYESRHARTQLTLGPMSAPSHARRGARFSHTRKVLSSAADEFDGRLDTASLR